MDAAVLTLFTALPFAVLILFFTDVDKIMSILSVFGPILIAFWGFYGFIGPDLVGNFLKWSYIGLTAMLPVVIYMFFVIACDSEKPEPLRVLLLTVLTGIVAAFIITAFGMPLFINGHDNELGKSVSDSFSTGFLRIATPAELSKWVLLLVFLSLNKYYDEYLDGIVYSVCLSMGFSGVLGIWFMSEFVGASTSIFLFKGVTTAFILIPIHLMSGAAMGYFIALGKRKRKFLNTLCALFVPILIDGSICSLLAMIGGNWWCYLIIGVILLLLSIGLYRQIIHLTRLDNISIN